MLFAIGCVEQAVTPIAYPPPRYVDTTPPPPPCERILRIEVRKSERALVAYCEGGAEEHMTAALGREPQGTKLREGDWHTPEGRYRVSGTLAHNRFHGFIPLDYPSLADAENALLEGRIRMRDYQRIADAHARGEQPPDDTPLGGRIGIHGEGPRWAGDSEHLDWTYGCVAVRDADLDFLAERLEIGAEVLILP
jgi:murein L,D-transpeptidase YafK